MVQFSSKNLLAILLPHKEFYGASGAGAVSHCVRQQILNSRFREKSIVLGRPVDRPFNVSRFHSISLSSILKGRKSRRYIYSACQWLKDNDIPCVEVHNRPQYISYIRRQLPKIAISLYLHNDPQAVKGFRSVSARKRLLEMCDSVICVSDYIRAQMLFGLERHPRAKLVQTVLNGTDTDKFAPTEKRNEIVFVGRLSPEKGAHIFVDAVNEILPSFPDWRAILVGAKWFSGEAHTSKYEKNVINAFKKLGDQSDVTGLITHDKVAKCLNSASIAVVPSCWEDPCPLTAIEALASGCALITTKRGGLPEIADDSALFISPEPTELAQALQVIICNKDIREKLQKQGRNRAEKYLNTQRVAKEVDNIRDSLLAGKGLKT